MNKLSGAARATVCAALREMNEGNRDEALACMHEMGTGELVLVSQLLNETAALARHVRADREAPRNFRLVVGE